jgi:hypothetical protein
MKLMRGLWPGVCAVWMMAALAFSARSATLVANGSLEDLNNQFVNTAANYMALSAGATSIANWMVSAGTTGQIVGGKSPTSDGHNAAAGTFFVDLTGFGSNSPNGAIQQTLSGLVLGQSYSFSMDVEVVGSLPLVTVGNLTVSLSGGPPFPVGTDSWTPETGTFIANATSPVLKIMNQTPGQQITFIDNIAVSGPTVPEPTTIPVLALVVIGFLRTARGTRNV